MEAVPMKHNSCFINWTFNQSSSPCTYSLALPSSKSFGFLYDRYSSIICVCLNFFTFGSDTSYSASSSYLELSLSIFILPSELLSKTFLVTLVWFILMRGPNHSNTLRLVSATRTGVLYSSHSSWLVMILQTPWSVIDPFTFFKIFHSHVFNLTISFPFKNHIPYTYTASGYNTVLFILILMFCSQS
jgi:hypothetical protein